MDKNFKLKTGDKVFCKSRIDGEQHIFAISKTTTIGEIESDWGFVTQVLRPIGYKKIYEKKEILDEEEKKYLSAVIRPFRNNVKYVKKRKSEWLDKEYIMIKLEDEAIDLPYFNKGTMYKGMKLYEKYTIEELNL